MVLLRMFAFTPSQGELSGSAGSGGETTKASPIAGLLSTINGKTSSGADPVVSTKPMSTIVPEAEKPKTKQNLNPARKLLDVIDQKREPADGGVEDVEKSVVEKSVAEDVAIESKAVEPPVVESTKAEVEEPESEERESEASDVGTPIVLEDWTQTLTQLGLSGVTQTLAANCTLQRMEGSRCFLLLNEHHASLWNKTHESRISRALTEHLGQKVSVGIEVGTTETETPAQADSRQQQERQAQAVVAIENDEHIQELIQNFNGTLDRDSIAPMQPGD